MRKVVLAAAGVLLLAGTVAFAQNLAAVQGQLEDILLVDDQEIQLYFFETPGGVALGRDDTNVCRMRYTFDDFVYALGTDADQQIWAVVAPCGVADYVAVCLDLTGRGRNEVCASFTLLLSDIEWID